MAGDIAPVQLFFRGVEVGRTGFGVNVGVGVGKIGLSLVGVTGKGWNGVNEGAGFNGAETKITSAVGGGGREYDFLGVIAQPKIRSATPINVRRG
jgi:hypothetical protein